MLSCVRNLKREDPWKNGFYVKNKRKNRKRTFWLPKFAFPAAGAQAKNKLKRKLCTFKPQRRRQICRYHCEAYYSSIFPETVENKNSLKNDICTTESEALKIISCLNLKQSRLQLHNKSLIVCPTSGPQKIVL